jgi:hypothetical protein
MSKYIEEFGLKKVRNASNDTDKQADVAISNGFLTLNKVAADIINVEELPIVEVYSGEQGGATIFALTFSTVNTMDSVGAKVTKKGTARVSLKVPLKKHSYKLKGGINVNLVDIDVATLVFSIGTIKEEPKAEEEQPERKGRPAPFGQMTVARESFDDQGKPLGVEETVGGGMGVPFADSDF